MAAAACSVAVADMGRGCGAHAKVYPTALTPAALAHRPVCPLASARPPQHPIPLAAICLCGMANGGPWALRKQADPCARQSVRRWLKFIYTVWVK